MKKLKFPKDIKISTIDNEIIFTDYYALMRDVKDPHTKNLFHPKLSIKLKTKVKTDDVLNAIFVTKETQIFLSTEQLEHLAKWSAEALNCVKKAEKDREI